MLKRARLRRMKGSPSYSQAKKQSGARITMLWWQISCVAETSLQCDIVNCPGLDPVSKAFASLAVIFTYGSCKPETVRSAVVFSSGSASGVLSLTRPDTFGVIPHRYRKVTVWPDDIELDKVNRTELAV